MNIRSLKNNKLITDSAYYYVGKIIPGLVGLFSVPVFIRLFGNAVYGEYSILISTVLLSGTFLSGWISQTYIRFYTQKNDKVLYTFFTYKILMLCNIIFIPIMFVGLILFKYSWQFSLLLTVVFFFLTVFSFLSEEKRAKLKSKNIVLADTVRALSYILSILMFYFLFSDNSKIALIILFSGNLIGYFTGSLILKSKFFGISNIVSIFKHQVSKPVFKEMLNYGLPIALWMITAYLLNISDRYIIKYYLNFENVGVYSAVYDVFYKFMTFAFMPLLMAFQPLIIKFYNEGNFEKVKRYYRYTILLLLLVFICLIIPVMLFKEIIVVNFLNINEKNAVKLILPIFIGSFIWNLSMFVHKPLELKQKTKLMFYGVLGAFIINFTGNIVFIPKFGIVAAAYTTLAGTLFYLLFVIFNSEKINDEN
jgi:O-antigen/teichoic acid export membrane protein